MLGAMLRIDVLDVPFAERYRIPPDNPFAGQAKCGPTDVNPNSCPEIYAWGLRNPWRWSFDREVPDKLWAGDVGQRAREEIDLIELGGNYGWDCREGTIPFDDNQNPACIDATGFVEPEIDYPRANGNQSVTGGFVYRGTEIPELIGRYVFADYASGRIWALQDDGAGGYTQQEIFDAPFLISSFAEAANGELYITEYDSLGNAPLHLLVPGTSTGQDLVPDDLFATGCLNDPARENYAINAPFWSDGAIKFRALRVPDGETITFQPFSDWETAGRQRAGEIV